MERASGLVQADAGGEPKDLQRPRRHADLPDDMFHLLVDSVRDYAIFILDPEGRIATWNPGAERLKGYRADEIIGRHFSTFYPDEDVARGKPAQELRIAEEYGRFEDEGWRIRQDGSRFWANVIIAAMRDPRDGRLVGFSKVTRDLTERRLAEESLRQSEERFRMLVDGIGDYAIFLLDPRGVVQSWNRGAERVKGFRAPEIVGQPFTRFYAEEDVREGKPWRNLEAARREGRFEDEGWRIRKDGKRFWANVIITALRDPRDGRLLGFSKVTRDLTERRRSEEALRRAYHDMEAFSYTVSHDLRAPLRAILELADFTLRDHAGALPAEAAENLGAMRASADRAARLVEDLIRFAKSAGGELRRERVDLAAIARRAAQALAARHPHRVEFALRDVDLLVATGDGPLLQVAVENLLANAWKYTQSVENPAVEMSASLSDDGELAVRVRDNGVGFDPARAATLFQPFQRLHGDAFAGSGIGLATVRRIVERHGGRVFAEGAPGKGATFSFT
ncbi:MAG TPA: PAS domain-containing sensor histidine kinase, partial [Candidatus Thermoplasmatota archaeon]|nr:PAS domain-containing sensor histidine kinase [Candidatus Thermoplasmatota archaeon]